MTFLTLTGKYWVGQAFVFKKKKSYVGINCLYQNGCQIQPPVTHAYTHTQTHTPIFTSRSLTYQSLTRICMAALCWFISSFSFKWTQLQLLTLTLLHLYTNLENFSKRVGPTPCFPLPNHAKDRYKQIFLQATDSLHLDKIYFNEIIFIIPLFYYSIQ